jgi:hypothetical protein
MNVGAVKAPMLHRTRHLFIRQQTAVINAIRAHLAELGIVAPVGRNGVEELLKIVADPADKRVPDIARACLAALGAQLRRLKEQILEFDRMIMAWHRSNEASRSTIAPRSSWPTTWNEFLPISMPIVLGASGMACSLSLVPLASLKRWRSRSTAGPSH